MDELQQIRNDVRLSTSLDQVRRSFERLQEIRRQYQNDFDLQIIAAEAHDEIIERARAIRAGGKQFEPEPIDPEQAEIPPDIPKLNRTSWHVAVGLAVLLTVGVLATFFYLIQAARKLNFSSDQPATPAVAKATPPIGKATPAAAVTPSPQPVASTAPTLRLYTDLTGGTATIDDQPAKDLSDGELDLNSLAPGTHTVKVESHAGSAAFTFTLPTGSDLPEVSGLPKSSNAMVVLVATKDGTGHLSTDASDANVAVDEKSAGTVTNGQLLLSDLDKRDHTLEVSAGKDQQKFVLTYTPAPTLTVFVKSDPSTGVLTVSTGLDGVTVFVNGFPYKRLTEHGAIRIPLKVDSYRIKVHKDGFQDPAVATVDVKKSAEASVIFHLQPLPPQYATLVLNGAQPATVVSVDHQVAATVGLDGTAKVINIQPGEHLVELQHESAVTKQLDRNFELGKTVTLSGADVALDRLAADNKSVIPANPGPPIIPPPVVPEFDTASNQNPAAEQVHRGGGFLPYHTPKLPGRYFFQAHAKLGGVLRKSKLQWYAGYQDSGNYVLFSLDGKHAEVKEVRDGRAVDVGRIAFPVESEQWVQIEVNVNPDKLQARARAGEGEWRDLSPVTSSDHDFTKDNVGIYVPPNEEVAVANFRFSSR
jgi:CheY-like chemotaxis protein